MSGLDIVTFDGPQASFADPNQQAVHANATITSTGNVILTGYGVSEVSLFINVKATPTGTAPTLQYTLQEVDPGDGTTLIGNTISSTLITATGIQRITLPSTFGGSIKISWVIGGTATPTFSQVYATLVGKAATVALVDASGNSIASTNPLRTDPVGTTVQPIQITTPNQLAVSIAANAFPAGFLRTTDEPRQVFYDPFDGVVIDTNNWNTPVSSGGGVASATSGGNLTLGTGTTASGYSYIQSVNSFRLTVPGWLGNSHAIKLENPVTANTYRFWGVGSVPGSPTASSFTTAGNSVTNGIGFELGTDGRLLAVVWASGVRTIVQDLSSLGNSKQPTDANFHRYIVYIRTDKIYWYIDGLELPVATANFTSPTIQTLPILYLAVAGTIAPSSSGIITSAGIANWDTAKNNTTISDGTYGWRKATVKPASTAAIASDTAIVVAISPNNPISTTAGLVADRTSTGNITALNGFLAISAQGVGNVGVTITGAWIATLTFQGTIDGTNWFNIQASPLPTLQNSVTVSSTTVNNQFTIPCSGLAQVRITATAYTSGTAVVTLEGNQTSSIATGIQTVQQTNAANLTATVTQGPAALASAPWMVSLSDGTAAYVGTKTGQLPAALVGGRLDGNIGSWLGSTVPTVGSKTSANSIPVVIASDQSSITTTNPSVGAIGVADPLSATLIGGAVAPFAPSYASGSLGALSLTTNGLLRVDGSGVTQTINGSVTANQGGSPWSENITQFGGSNVVTGLGTSGAGIPRVTVSSDTVISSKITDGTNTSAVKAASTAAVAADPSLVVAPSPNSAGPVYLTTPNELANSPSIFATNSPFGMLRTSPEPSTLFYDQFPPDGIDTTWFSSNAGGGVLATNAAAGTVTLGTGTTANGYSYFQTLHIFPPVNPGWLGINQIVKIENPVTANTYRFWGHGNIAGSPTASSKTTPGTSMVDSIGWEIGTDGKLLAVVWVNATRTIVQDLSATGNSKQPTDANPHLYSIYIRTDKIYWYIDSIDVPVATASFTIPFFQGSPVIYVAIAGSVAPTSSGVITAYDVAVFDTGRGNQTISDGVYPYIKTTVKNPNTAPTTSDRPLVVTVSPVSNTLVQTPDTTSTATLSSLNAAVTVALAGNNSAGFFISTTSLTATLFVELSFDGGTNWISTYVQSPNGFTTSFSLVYSANTVTGNYSVLILNGVSHVRVRVNAYTSGSATVTLRAANTTGSPFTNNCVIGNSTTPTFAVPIGGHDGVVTFRAINVSAKGIQGPAGLAVQNLKDSGRVLKTYTATAVAGVTAEALISLTPYAAFTAGVAATSFGVTAGKTLRLQQITVTWRNNTAAAGGVTIRLRGLNSGTTLVSSPVQLALNASTSLTTIGSGQTAILDIPDGFELTSNMTFGVTQLAVTAVVGFDISVIGFEY